MSEYKTGREAIEAVIEYHLKKLGEYGVMLNSLPVEILDTEVDSVSESGSHLYLIVTDTEPKTVGKLMGVIHKMNKDRYYNVGDTLWKKSWNPEVQVFEGIAVDKERDAWFWVVLRKKTGLGTDCKRYKVRQVTEYEKVICGEPELSENEEILEVIE